MEYDRIALVGICRFWRHIGRTACESRKNKCAYRRKGPAARPAASNR
jgi:hypothetical protein